MTTAWRIVKSRHAGTAFTGDGAAKNGGRWNSRGCRIIYTSGTQSLAALELLVHLNPPLSFSLEVFPVEFDPEWVTEIPVARLPAAWRSQPPPSATQQLGDNWVREGRSAILAVPSVLVPEERNYLLNPAHPDFRQVRIGASRPFTLDPRLLR
jgi:RES domain-containing protein